MQYDAPDDPRDYIHRVGRTARAGKVGQSLLFLHESELGFLRYLKEAKVPLNEYSINSNRVRDVQSQVSSPLNFGDINFLPSCKLIFFSLKLCYRKTTTSIAPPLMAIGHIFTLIMRTQIKRYTISTRLTSPK